MVQFDDEGRPPLELALQKKHEAIAKTLLSHAANVNIVKPDGFHLLHSFILAKNIAACLFLIKVCCDVSFSCHGQNNADVYIVDSQKRSALHLAAEMVMDFLSSWIDFAGSRNCGPRAD